jgi:hypothetical protein
MSFSFTCPGQDKDALESKIKTFHNSKKFEVTYDKLKDRSNVWGGWFTIHPSTESRLTRTIEFGAAFPFAGRELKNAPEKITLFLKSAAGSQNLENASLVFFVDEKVLDLGVGYEESAISQIVIQRVSKVRVSLKSSFLVTPEECRYLAEGKTVGFRFGDFTGLLNDEHKQFLKDLLALGALKK